MCVFLISPVPIAEPLTSELIDTPVFYNLAPRPIKYRVSVPIPSHQWKLQSEKFSKYHHFLPHNRIKKDKEGNQFPDYHSNCTGPAFPLIWHKQAYDINNTYVLRQIPILPQQLTGGWSNDGKFKSGELRTS